jgi:hypothetical protein
MSKRRRWTQHHRKLSSDGGDKSPENLVWVTDKQHKAWHLLFNSDGPNEIARKCNEIWLPPDPGSKFIVAGESPIGRPCSECGKPVLKKLVLQLKVIEGDKAKELIYHRWKCLFKWVVKKSWRQIWNKNPPA